MGTGDEGSVTNWLGGLKAGDQAASQALWGRYFEKLVQLARSRLRAARRPGLAEDEEDAALSAFDSFCNGVARGRFPQLGDRDDLWRLLVVITARKAVDQLERHGRQRRGGGRVVAESDLAVMGSEPGAQSLDRLIGPEPSPEFAAMVAEEYERLLSQLGDDELRLVAVRKMEGHTTDEIAVELGVGRRTVARRLDQIRVRWLREKPVEETP